MNSIEILTKLVQGLKTLKEEQFNYSNFVIEYDIEKGCGTVCCAWGWMPALVPEAGVEWSYCILKGNYTTNKHPSYILTDISNYDIEFMFYGGTHPDMSIQYGDGFGDKLRSNLHQVINRIEYIIDKYSAQNNS